MIWLLRNGYDVLYRGSRDDALDEADRLGVLFRVRRGEIGGRSEVLFDSGRGYHADGTELPARLERGWSLVPEGTVRARRAAA